MPQLSSKMSPLRSAVLVLAVASLLFSCNRSKPTSPEASQRFESIIPKPVSATMTGKTFTLTKETQIFVEEDAEGVQNVARFLSEKLRPATGFDLQIATGEGAGKASISLSLRSEERRVG